MLQVTAHFQPFGGTIPAYRVTLHVGQVRGVRRRISRLQVLAHTHHAHVVASGRVNLRAPVRSLKLIETTGTTFAGVVESVLNVTSLERLLRIDARQSGRLLRWLLGIRIRCKRVSLFVEQVLLVVLDLVRVVVKVAASVDARRHLETCRIRLVF